MTNIDAIPMLPRKRRARKAIAVTETGQVAVRQKPVKEIIAENSAALATTFEGLRFLAKQEFHQALISLELPTITKDNKITLKTGGSYRVVSFENLHDRVVPLLRAAGLRFSFQEIDQPDRTVVKVNCVLTNGLYEEASIVTMPTAPGVGQSPQQGHASALTFACRHGMMRLINLNSHAPDDRDAEPAPPVKTITGTQAKKLSDDLAKINVTEKQFCDKFAIPSIDKLPAAQLPEAQEAIARRKSQ